MTRKLLTVLLGLLLTGCSALLRSSRIDPNATPREIFAQIANNYRGLEAFEGRGRLIIDTPDLKFDAPSLVLLQKPDTLFIKIEAILGIDVGFFFADGRRFESYSPLENTFFFGEVGAMHQVMLFQVEISYDEIMSAIVGSVLPPYDTSYAMDVADGAYRFSGRRNQWQVSFWVDPERGVITKAEQYDSSGALYARQTFQRFRRLQGVWLPQLIRLEKPQQRERMTVYYSRVAVNQKIDREQMRIKVPASATHISLSNAAAELPNSPSDEKLPQR